MKLKQGLAALTLAAGINCGGTEIQNHYYGPNGEEYEVNSGDCDEFKGKYLWANGDCIIGTVEPIGQGCEVRMVDPDRPQRLLEGFMQGNRFTILNASGFRKIDEGQYTLPIVYQFLKKGEFSREDFYQQDRNAEIDSFMCYFDQGDNELRAGVINGKLYSGSEAVFRLTNRPYPGERICAKTELNHADWYVNCHERGR
ncbi:MAG TPA: hypothetical protein VJH68_05235 [Candidatus Nanoarchaeia archaeon]|nr:hypothetical protein [Candidatus Nanoarchaeia archaeon]